MTGIAAKGEEDDEEDGAANNNALGGDQCIALALGRRLKPDAAIRVSSESCGVSTEQMEKARWAAATKTWPSTSAKADSSIATPTEDEEAQTEARGKGRYGDGDEEEDEEAGCDWWWCGARK
jgi:hypothetical protein